MDDGGDGIEEGELLLAADPADVGGQRRRGQGAGGDDGAAPIRAGGRPATSSRRIRISGSALKRLGDVLGEALAVDRQRAAGRQLVPIAPWP